MRPSRRDDSFSLLGEDDRKREPSQSSTVRRDGASPPPLPPFTSVFFGSTCLLSVGMVLFVFFALLLHHSQGSSVNGSGGPSFPPANLTTSPLNISRQNTMLLMLDYIEYTYLMRVPQQNYSSFAAQINAITATARKAQIPIVWSTVAFRPGYPEVSDRNLAFYGIKEEQVLMWNTSEVEIYKELVVAPQDIVIVKKRMGALQNTELPNLLSAHSISSIVVAGIATSGAVLTTVRMAADSDLVITVIADACVDGNPAAHEALVSLIFPLQATVIQSADWPDFVSLLPP